MELKIYNPAEDGYLQSVDWNFEELKQEITAKANDYMSLVYSDDQIKEARKDRANLRKFVTALENERKALKKRILAPYDHFEAQEKELTGIIQKAIDNIDSQVQGYEEASRNEKLEKVKKIYAECIGDLDRVVPFEKIFKDSWLNVSTTQKSIREEITAIYQKVDTELKLINNDGSRYVFEMKEEYLKNFDLSAATALKQQLEENERKKAEFEAQRKQEEEERQRRLEEEARRIAQAGRKEQTEQEAMDPGKETDVTKESKDAMQQIKRKRLTIQITANEEQFDYLNKVLMLLTKNAEKVEILKKEEL